MEELLLNVNPLWVWLGLACLLFAIEVLIVPLGFFLCLGTAAAVVGLLVLIFPSLPWLWAMTLFALISVIACWIWWRIVRKKQNAMGEDERLALNTKTKQLIGYRGVLEQPLKAGKGKLKVNDSPWLVEADRDYPAGTQVEVVDVKGITLIIRAD